MNYCGWDKHFTAQAVYEVMLYVQPPREKHILSVS